MRTWPAWLAPIATHHKKFFKQFYSTVASVLSNTEKYKIKLRYTRDESLWKNEALKCNLSKLQTGELDSEFLSQKFIRKRCTATAA